MNNREVFENSKASATIEGNTLVRGLEGAFESIDELKNTMSSFENMIKRIESQSNEAKEASNKEYERAFYNACFKSFSENRPFEDCIDSKFSNEVTGFPFPEHVDYEIRKAWKNYEHIFSVLKSTNRTQFLINTQDQEAAEVTAKLHTRKAQKEEQTYNVQSVNFIRGYIYKLNYIERIDWKRAENDGSLAMLIAEIFGEITTQIAYLIVKSILAESLTDASGTVIEAVADSALAVSKTGTATVENVRALADEVEGDGRKIAFMTSSTKTNLMKVAPGSASGLYYMTEDILCAQLGVDEIITFRGMDTTKPVVILIDQAYAVYNISDMQRIQFDKWEYNRTGLLVEVLTSGRLITPKGAGVLKTA